MRSAERGAASGVSCRVIAAPILRARAATLVAAGLLALAPVRAGAQEPPPVPGGADLLEWMGLEPGASLVFEASDGERRCVTVGEPRGVDGRPWAPLVGLEWPGLASDSRVVVPLDGSLELGVVATPGPRPHVRPLLAGPLRSALPAGWSAEALLDPAAPLSAPGADGWYALGPADRPDLLVHVECAACVDAGSRVVLGRGRGVLSIVRTTIAGTESLRRVPGGCAEREADEGIEFEIYVLPADPADP